MPRVHTTNAEAPSSSATTEMDNPCHCCENRDQFSKRDVDAAPDRREDESEQDSDAAIQRAINRHSNKVRPCINGTVHQHGPHYVCTSCSSLANTYLRSKGNPLLHGGYPPMQGQRYFPLCQDCLPVAKISSHDRNCLCDCLRIDLCFQCKRDYLDIAATRRDTEVRRRMEFVPVGGENPDGVFMKPVMRCICGNEKVVIRNPMNYHLRCAGCRALVPVTSHRAWDPIARDFIVFPNPGA